MSHKNCRKKTINFRSSYAAFWNADDHIGKATPYAVITWTALPNHLGLVIETIVHGCPLQLSLQANDEDYDGNHQSNKFWIRKITGNFTF